MTVHCRVGRLITSSLPRATSGPDRPRTWDPVRRARVGRLSIVGGGLALLAGCTAVMDPYAAAPSVSAKPWQPPAREARSGSPSTPSSGRPSDRIVSRQSGDSLVEPDIVYDLPGLIDLAQRANPETRRSWEDARAAAARLGRAQSAYFPTLSAAAAAGTSRVADRTAVGEVTVEGPALRPQVELAWVLLDFGRRGATVDQASQQLLEANWSFNRKHQEVAYAVSRNFFALDASRARVTAARVSLESATTVTEAVEARLAQGLATRPELLLARQEQARAAFELQDTQGLVADAQAALAESLGISPMVPLRVVELAALPLPGGLTDSVEKVIDQALARRPDLAARLAALRAREAEVRGARAEFWPKLGVAAAVGGDLGRYRADRFGPFDVTEPVYGAFLTVEWRLFDGFERENALREATARRGAALAELSALELRTLREVWKAYADVKTALEKRDFARALLAASEEAYAASLESYRVAGLATVLDLLAAQRDLARARFTEIQSRADLLQASAALVFAAGG